VIQLSEKKCSDTQTEVKVEWRVVLPEEAGQRLDNFLQRVRGGVPKTRIYRAIRKGEVRVDKGRVKPDIRLEAGVCVRIPPLRVPEKAEAAGAAGWRSRLRAAIVREEATLLVINKPPGLAVHGGSGVNVGLIETLKGHVRHRPLFRAGSSVRSRYLGTFVSGPPSVNVTQFARLVKSNGVDSATCVCQCRWPAHLSASTPPLRVFSLRERRSVLRRRQS